MTFHTNIETLWLFVERCSFQVQVYLLAVLAWVGPGKTTQRNHGQPRAEIRMAIFTESIFTFTVLAKIAMVFVR